MPDFYGEYNVNLTKTLSNGNIRNLMNERTPTPEITSTPRITPTPPAPLELPETGGSGQNNVEVFSQRRRD